jgi:hypothetical protein
MVDIETVTPEERPHIVGGPCWCHVSHVHPEHGLDCCDLCAARIEAIATVLGQWTPIMLAFGELIAALQNNPSIARMAGLEVPSRRERKRAAKGDEPDAG